MSILLINKTVPVCQNACMLVSPCSHTCYALLGTSRTGYISHWVVTSQEFTNSLRLKRKLGPHQCFQTDTNVRITWSPDKNTDCKVSHFEILIQKNLEWVPNFVFLVRDPQCLLSSRKCQRSSRNLPNPSAL